MPTIRVRLAVPLNLFPNARHPSVLNPSLEYLYGDCEIKVTLKDENGGEPQACTAGCETR